MKKVNVGDFVAVNIYPRFNRLGDDYGIVKAEVIAVDPELVQKNAPYRRDGESDGTVVYRDKKSIYHYEYYLDDGQGKAEPFKGIVYVEYVIERYSEEYEKAVPTTNRFCFPKRKVLGTWDEHVRVRDARKAADDSQRKLSEAQHKWDDKTVDAIQEHLAASKVLLALVGPRDGRVDVSIESLARALGLDIKPRP